MVTSNSSFPERVRIREVGPRDGFQNEPELISTDDKVRLIEMLGATGVKRMEITSFVRPDVIPQLSDGAEVLARIELPDDLSRAVIVPTPKGLDNALASGLQSSANVPLGGRVKASFVLTFKLQNVLSVSRTLNASHAAMNSATSAAAAIATYRVRRRRVRNFVDGMALSGLRVDASTIAAPVGAGRRHRLRAAKLFAPEAAGSSATQACQTP